MLADHAARARIAGDLDHSLVVEAAAGTGKTQALIGRIVSMLQAGRTTLDRIVAVTFTEKAAGEMKLRLRAELGAAREAAADAQTRANLEQALSALELAHINTIHGFCADLLRERPIEAGVDPAFEVLDETASDALLQRAFDDWFGRMLDAPEEGVRRVLRRRTWKSERIGPREQLLSACRDLCEHRDFAAAWPAPQYDRKAALDAVFAELCALGQLGDKASSPSDNLGKGLRAIAELTREVTARERMRSRDHDQLEATLLQLKGWDWKWAWNQKGSGTRYGEGLERRAVLEQRAAVQRALEDFLKLAEVDLAAKLQRELSVVVQAREALKQSAGALDFVDLLLCARNLLRDDAAVRRELSQRFTHVFVDEFQDTDPLQADIALLLATEPTADDPSGARLLPGKLFVVGDPKQSIYRFRRADVSFYERIKLQLLDSGAELLHLTTSFRSLPEIQAAVNNAFSRLMIKADDGSQAQYVALTPYRAAVADQPAVVALPIPDPYGFGGMLRKGAVEASYPDAVAAFVAWLRRDSGWTVEEEGKRVAVEARHVCLLFRRFQSFGEDLTRGYVRALEARGIPHVLVGGRSLHGREEVIALRAALTAIEWPDDALSVYATLRGPFFAIADDELLAARTELGTLHPLRKLGATTDEHVPVIEALALLRRLHGRRNRRPIADTISELLDAVRAHAGLAIWPTGEQALANVLALIDAARGFEARAATSFRSFVDWLDDQADHGTGSEAPIVEEGTEGVRLMTVHKAKGLEFPIVVLCDPTAPSTPTTPSRYVDPAHGLWAQRLCGCRPQSLLEHEAEVLRHDEAEHVRLAYVAATRARELLVVPIFGDGRSTHQGIGWVDALASAVYPSDSKRRSPQPAPGCPAFHGDSVRTRPSSVQAMPEDSVAPGLHASFGDGSPVVVWDPNALALDVQAAGGVGQQELLVQTEQSAEWVEAHHAWQKQREQTLLAASKPAFVARSVTALAAERALQPEPAAESGVTPPLAVAIERTDVPRAGRPRGTRFGSLVHAVLAHVPLDAAPALIETIARAQARLVLATDAELNAAIVAVAAALRHPLMLRAANALDLRREIPVAHDRDDGVLSEGIIDLAFREATGWVVVDFKTDAELIAPRQYEEQLRLYAAAITAATGEPAQALLFGV